MRFWLSYEIEHVLGDVRFEVQVQWTQGEREVRYTRNGDGYPGSPPEVEVLTIDVMKITNGYDNVELEPAIITALKTDLEVWCEDNYTRLLEDANQYMCDLHDWNC